MHRHVGSLGLLLVLGLASAGCNNALDGQEVFQATLSGAEEVPARSTAAFGATGFTVDGGTVHYSVEVRQITGVTGSHIHIAAAGSNGPIRVSLYPGGVTNFATSPTGAINGILLQGSFTASELQAGISLDQLLSSMRDGNAYVNVHTSTFPGGEIRGQIRSVSVD